MSLRTKLFLLFAAFSVAPLLLVGLFDYVHAMRTVEAHLAAQGSLIAEPVTRAMDERLASHQSDLALLAENTETQRLYAAAANGRTAAMVDSVIPYLEEVWQQFSPWYYSIELQDREGRGLVRLGGVDAALLGSASSAPFRSERPVIDAVSGERVGTVVALVRSEALLPGDALASRYGEQGYNLVVDRGSRRIVHHPRYALRGQPLDSLPSVLAEALRVASTAPVPYRQGDTARVAVLTHHDSPAWTLVTSSSTDEFAAPFARMRLINLALVGVIIVVVSLGSTVVIRRETRSLAQLTAAAARVGSGDFTPDLPEPGSDEVGQLSSAFANMTSRVREMMTQVEESRQMAAIGGFAAEIAHEIRNPLTSVKLNLQRIQRLAEEGRLPAGAEQPLAISMREIHRLERVVRGVLYLGRSRAAERQPCSLQEVVDESLELVRPHAEQNAVAVERSLPEETLAIAADPGQLRAALLNLYMNAVEAMPAGGTLRIGLAHAEPERVALLVSDTGPGIPRELRERLFHPFFTTKPDGTGLGLAIAMRTIEEHGGHLSLGEPVDAVGTSFRVELPVIAPGVVV